MIDLKSIFPKGAKDFFSANAAIMEPSGKENALQANVAPKKAKRGVMNKTESEFAMILEARKRAGQILRYEFEGITLRFANVKYTPDFVVFRGSDLRSNGWTRTGIKLIEVKGPFIKGNRERAVERFRHAKTFWPEFTFELHQRTKAGWKQII